MERRLSSTRVRAAAARTGAGGTAIMVLMAGLMLLAGVAAAIAWPARAGDGETAQPTLTESGQPVATAVFAGGCFWCVESDFDKVPGVLATISGYAGGQVANPTYQDVTAGGTGHLEVVKIVYDPAKVSYPQLVSFFWRTIDPLDDRGQFCDKGGSYLSAIFPLDSEQEKVARDSLKELKDSKRFAAPIATTVRTGATFWPAEDYHQDFYKNNPIKYDYYRALCGRDLRVRNLWGDEAHKLPTAQPAG